MSDQKRRITKSEKITELQSKLKLLTEENKRLKEKKSKKEKSSTRQDSGDSTSTNNYCDSSENDGPDEGSSKSHGERDKLKEALRALKRVTIKQEMSLATLRQRSKQRRSEIDQKDNIIKNIQNENEAYRIAHGKIRDNGQDDVISVLKARLVDLELQLAKEESCKAEQSVKLKEREAGISSLQAKLAYPNKGRGLTRKTSSDSTDGLSLVSASSSLTSVEDFARMKKELAKKTEKITNLQYELEACKDEIHDLKQMNRFNNPFPIASAQGDDDDDFFEDDDMDNDAWETF
mmetsp:Transcript_39566/g.44540  ORF Transcript_39566/g.44540 Transcript_39566/m.44540 type:complete len:291 (-) Transcript_39566:76-948(-)